MSKRRVRLTKCKHTRTDPGIHYRSSFSKNYLVGWGNAHGIVWEVDIMLILYKKIGPWKEMHQNANGGYLQGMGLGLTVIFYCIFHLSVMNMHYF